MRRVNGSLRLDAGGPDDRPPLLDVGLLHRSERLGRLLFARVKGQPKIRESCPYVGRAKFVDEMEAFLLDGS